MNNIHPKFGYAALIGATNAGKSTLFNQLLGTKIAITSHKVQTTRTRVTGILQHDNCQIALVDTPGIFNPKRTLDNAMIKAAWQALKESNITVLLIDARTAKIDDEADENLNIINKLQQQNINNAVLLLNKIDMIDKDKLPSLAQYYYDTKCFRDVLMVSALKGDGVDDLRQLLIDHTPISPWHYDEDNITDMPDRLLAAEITREKILQYLHQELPYEIMVETISFKETPNDIHIQQNIIATRDNHKAIIIGKNGQKLKAIGRAARLDLSDIFDKPTHVFLHVKIRKDWQERHEYYQEWGL